MMCLRNLERERERWCEGRYKTSLQINECKVVRQPPLESPTCEYFRMGGLRRLYATFPCTSLLAPRSRSRETTAAWPLMLAKIRAVEPSWAIYTIVCGVTNLINIHH